MESCIVVNAGKEISYVDAFYALFQVHKWSQIPLRDMDISAKEIYEIFFQTSFYPHVGWIQECRLGDKLIPLRWDFEHYPEIRISKNGALGHLSQEEVQRLIDTYSNYQSKRKLDRCNRYKWSAISRE